MSRRSAVWDLPGRVRELLDASGVEYRVEYGKIPKIYVAGKLVQTLPARRRLGGRYEINVLASIRRRIREVQSDVS